MKAKNTFLLLGVGLSAAAVVAVGLSISLDSTSSSVAMAAATFAASVCGISGALCTLASLLISEQERLNLSRPWWDRHRG
jgi:hypothetical protein